MLFNELPYKMEELKKDGKKTRRNPEIFKYLVDFFQKE